jgi:uncharacterized protein YjbI with pentapeptide repeats
VTTLEQFPVRNRFTGAVQFTAAISVTPDMLPSVKLGLAVRWGCGNDADLRGADLSDADLRDANLRDANLRDANLRDANLRDANLSDANLSGADLRGADLRGANLRGADLRGADLRGADLRGADLRGANLRDANLSGADLRGADLRGADLRGADLRGANLSGADLRGADLRGADLRGANLRGADLHGANLKSFKADLWATLTMARHEVPALIAALRAGRVDGSQYEGACACLVGTLENAGATGLPHNSSDPAEQWFLMIREGDKPGDDTGGGFASAKALEWALEYCALTGIELEAEPTQ